MTKRMTKTPREMPEKSSDNSTSTSPLSIEGSSHDKAPGEITHPVIHKMTICVCVLCVHAGTNKEKNIAILTKLGMQ